MANYITKTLTLPTGYSYSNAIIIPRNHGSITIFTPSALALPASVNGTATSFWKIQSSQGETNDADSDVWYDAYTFFAGMGGLNEATQLAFPYVASQALAFPAWYLGVGAMRISTYDVNQPADAAFTVLFGSFNN